MKVKINSFENSQLYRPNNWKHIFAELNNDYFLNAKDSKSLYDELCVFITRYTTDLFDNTPLKLNFGVYDEVIDCIGNDTSIIIGQCCIENKSFGAIAVVNNSNVIYEYIEKGDNNDS